MSTASRPIDANATPGTKPIRAGIFSTVAAADQAVSALVAAGFTKDQITVICSNEVKEKHFKEFEHEKQAGSHTSNAALAGSAIGATLGGLAALTGVVATGGVGLLATGALLAAGGGVTGTFVGAMMTRGFEKEAANFYDQEVMRGKILVSVEDHSPQAAGHLAEAERILEVAGAEPIPLPRG